MELWSRHCLYLLRHTVGQMADLAVRYERDPVLAVVVATFIRAEGNLGVSSLDAGMRTTAPGSGRETWKLKGERGSRGLALYAFCPARVVHSRLGRHHS